MKLKATEMQHTYRVDGAAGGHAFTVYASYDGEFGCWQASVHLLAAASTAEEAVAALRAPAEAFLAALLQGGTPT